MWFNCFFLQVTLLILCVPWIKPPEVPPEPAFMTCPKMTMTIPGMETLLLTFEDGYTMSYNFWKFTISTTSADRYWEGADRFACGFPKKKKKKHYTCNWKYGHVPWWFQTHFLYGGQLFGPCHQTQENTEQQVALFVQESYSSPSPFPNRRVPHHLHQSVLFEQRFLRISKPWPSSSDSAHQQVVSRQAISVFSIHFWLNKININNHLYLVTWICLRWFFTFYHGKSLWKTTIWENRFVTFFQASNSRKSKVILVIGSKTIGEWLELYRSTGLACYEGKDLSRIVFWWKTLPRGIETWIRNCVGYI